MSTFVVKQLEHAKLLTDPFKLKLLEQFSEGPITTKQVADVMGEKAPRLYRHVDALAEAGFLELVSEKQKRGTVERYYKTSANRFEVDPDLFATSSDAADETTAMLRTVFQETLAEIADTVAEHGIAAFENKDAGIVMRLSVRASPRDIAALGQKLHDWVDSLDTIDEPADGDEPAEEWAGLIAFYPRRDSSDN